MNTPIESPIKLNPCYFCGYKVELIMNEDKSGFWTSCPHCWADGPFARTPEQAAKWFNNRTLYYEKEK